jgi:hypothetical protein
VVHKPNHPKPKKPKKPKKKDSMAQFIRPISDVADGLWTTTPFFSKIDEDIGGGGDDVTVASEAVANNTNTTNLDLEGTNSGIGDPSVSTGHILRVLWASSSVRNITGHLELWQGVPDTGSLLADATVEIVDATEVTTALTLSGAEADSITNYNDLHFRLWGRGTEGGPARSLVVDAIELEIPDASGTEHTATPTDDADVTDSTAAAKTITVEITDDVGVTDLITRVHDAQRTVIEAVGVTDVVTTQEIGSGGLLLHFGAMIG